MNHRFLLLVPLAAALALPAVGQQATAPTEQPDAVDSQDDLGPHQPLQPETRQGFWGHLNPFARKKYVQNQVAPIRNRVNELDELTASNTRMVKDVDRRATEGIRQAHAMATQADQHALEAGNRAQQANQTAQQASTRLNTVEQVVGNLDQYQPANELELRFRPGQLTLSKRDKDALDEIAASLKEQKGTIVEIQAFSPGRGQAAVANSQKMADAIVRYLVLNQQIPVYRIFELGMGNASVQVSAPSGNRTTTTRTNVSRVEVTVLKNGVDQLAQAVPASERGAARQGGGIGATTTTTPERQPGNTTPGGGITSRQQR